MLPTRCHNVTTKKFLKIVWILVENGRVEIILESELLLWLVIFIGKNNVSIDGSMEAEGSSGEFGVNPRFRILVVTIRVAFGRWEDPMVIHELPTYVQ
jgi:hypothetical protein